MKLRLFTFTVFFVVFTSGCSVQAILSPEAWRNHVNSESLFTKKTTFIVKRNYKDIGKTFANRSKACLKGKSVTYTHRDTTSASSITNRYTSRAVTKRKRAELYIQESRGGLRLHKEPEGGGYILVADATPITKNKTRVDIHHQQFGHDLLVTTVTKWAYKKNLGCPDLTKM